MAATPDLPYYAGSPVQVQAGGWLVILAGVALGFAALVAIPADDFPATLVPALLFAIIPLFALAAVTGRHWTALFRHVGPRQVGQMLLFAVATVAVSIAAGLIVSSTVGTNHNPIIAGLQAMSWGEMAVALIPTLPQLLGEELLTILPLLALLWLFHTRLGLSRNASVVVAVLGSSLLFGAAHLPTYGWNWAQALGVIGTARIVLTLAYVWTRNIWVSTGAHVINDWSEFAFAHATAGYGEG
jgi:membrane protease YdiL (CAAX protease family)